MCEQYIKVKVLLLLLICTVLKYIAQLSYTALIFSKQGFLSDCAEFCCGNVNLLEQVHEACLK